MSDLTATNCGGGCGGFDNSCIWIILILLFCGNGFGNNCGGGFFGRNDNDCSCIIIIILLLCFCGNGFGC